MKNWTAVVPLKGKSERKTRLASRLDQEQRWLISQQMFAHVTGVLQSCPNVSEVVLLSDLRPLDWGGSFVLDEGRGLNVELGSLACRLKTSPMLVMHADLPFVCSGDVEMLLAEATGGYSIAPDRHGIGTNAIAMVDPRGFEFSFGPNSFACHFSVASGSANIVRRFGLGLDIDSPNDLELGIMHGFDPEKQFGFGSFSNGAKIVGAKTSP